jgi:hypothetical protein
MSYQVGLSISQPDAVIMTTWHIMKIARGEYKVGSTTEFSKTPLASPLCSTCKAWLDLKSYRRAGGLLMNGWACRKRDPMRIESGTTGERRTRVAIFFLMCIGFTGWFARDGWLTYPEKNLAWAMQAMPEKPASASLNLQVTLANLKVLEKRAAGSERMTTAELAQLLGKPLYEQPRELTFVGSETTGVVRVADGKVVSAQAQPVSPTDKQTLPNFRVREESIKSIKAGMSDAELTAAFGQPTRTQDKVLWFVGPGAYAKVQVDGDRVLGTPAIFKATEPAESDIFTQKLLAGALLIVTVFVGAKLLQIVRTHVVLDEAGLIFNGRHVAFNDMTALDTGEYADKGWVELEYRQSEKQDGIRLDSYHIDRFREIVLAICERKGFTPPRFASKPDAPAARS